MSVFNDFKKATLWAKIRVVFLTSFCLCFVVVGSWVIYQIVLLEKGRMPLREVASSDEEEEVIEEPIARDVAAFTYTYTLSDISVPLANRNASRIAYAQFTLKADCPSDEAKKSLKINRAKMLDKIFEVATNFYIEDFENPQGHVRFKNSVKKALRKSFKKHAPRDLAVEKWVLN